MTCGSGSIDASSAHPANGFIAGNVDCLLVRISSNQGHFNAERKLRQTFNTWMASFRAQFPMALRIDTMTDCTVLRVCGLSTQTA